MNNEPNAAEQSQPGSRTYCYRFGTAEFDEARFELRVAGLPVEVERRALEVLSCLLRHAGEVVTKEELFRQVWAGRITVDKVLPNAIAKLRRALGETNAELLVTQLRIGYRLAGPVERIAVGRRLSSRLELAPGQPVASRENFILQRQLGSSRSSEVWLAQHAKTHEWRVYKFTADGERLRSLKREATLHRVLQESLDDRRHFVEIIDWNFENPPFFLECAYGGDNLLEWAKTSLAPLSAEARVALFLQIADAVAAAHGVGVLHKDLKPANVLVAAAAPGPLVRLTDFGSGGLLEPERLEELGITQLGLTLTRNLAPDSSSGTPLYLAPELFSGHAPTVQSDVFAIGLMLYQILAGNLSKPMAPGWEEDIADDLLREDIRLATHGDPTQRLASAAELAARLRNREARRAQEQRLRSVETQTRRAHESLARERARRPYRIALLAVLLGGLAVALGLFAETRHARDAAQRELQRASAVNSFLNEDLISKSNPLVLAKGQSAMLKDVLLAARGRVAERFADQPLAAAAIHANLGMLFNTIEQLPEAESEFRQALALYEQTEGPAALDSLKVRSDLARLLTRVSKFDAALEQIRQLEQLIGSSRDPGKQYLLASAWSLYHYNLSQFDKALPELQDTLRLLALTAPDNTPMRDTLRQQLIGVYRYSGHRPEAKHEAQALLEEMQARPQRNDLGIAFVKQTQAGSYIDDGDYDTAEAMLLDAQKTIVAALGPAHTRNLQLLNDLLDIAQERKDWPKALDYAQTLHEGMIAKFGPDHIMSSVTLGNWGQILYMAGDVRAGAAKLEQAYAKLATISSAQGAQTQYAGFWLAAARIDLGQTDQAGTLLATLKPELLESLIANGAWKARLEGLRSLWLSRRGQRQEAAQTLQAALQNLKPEQVDFIIFDKAKQALRPAS